MFLVKADIALPDETLRALRGREDAALGIDAALLAAAREAFGLPGTPLPGSIARRGTFHRLFEASPGQLLRIAVFAGPPWADTMAMEATLSERLRARSLEVPACEYRGLGHGAGERGAQLMEAVAGEPASAAEGDEPRMLARLEVIATFLARLHRISSEGAGPLSRESLAEGRIAGTAGRWTDFIARRLGEHVRECRRLGAIDAGEAARIEAIFADAIGEPPAAVLLHGDPGGHNFLFDGERLAAVIDWEDALAGDPLFELASLCTFHPPRRHGRILAAYGAPLEPAARRRFHLYFLRIALAKTVHRHRFGYTDPPGRPAAASRIQWALAALGEA